MRASCGILAFALVALAGCPKPGPAPTTPADATCGLGQTAHDALTDSVVGTLQNSGNLEGAVATYGNAAVLCIVTEVEIDYHDDTVTAAARAWRLANGGAP